MCHILPSERVRPQRKGGQRIWDGQAPVSVVEDSEESLYLTHLVLLREFVREPLCQGWAEDATPGQKGAWVLDV